MSTYGEGNTERVLIVVPDGNGSWRSETNTDRDPMLTLVRRFGRATTAGAQLVTAASTILHTPASGSAVRVKWVYLATPSSAVDTVATVKIGAAVTAYLVPLPVPGVFMRTSIREGAANGALTIDLSPATSVYVNYELEEFTP